VNMNTVNAGDTVKLGCFSVESVGVKN